MLYHLSLVLVVVRFVPTPARLIVSILPLTVLEDGVFQLIPSPCASLAPTREPMSFEVAGLSVNSSGCELAAS